MLATEHCEVIAAAGWMAPAMALATLVGIAIVTSGLSVGGWGGIVLIVLGAFVALTGAGSLGFLLWGQFVGFGWHFTK